MYFKTPMEADLKVNFFWCKKKFFWNSYQICIFINLLTTPCAYSKSMNIWGVFKKLVKSVYYQNNWSEFSKMLVQKQTFIFVFPRKLQNPLLLTCWLCSALYLWDSVLFPKIPCQILSAWGSPPQCRPLGQFKQGLV